MLLTRSPLIPDIATRDPSDLHVLGTPPAFTLSQDQTLQLFELLRVLYAVEFRQIGSIAGRSALSFKDLISFYPEKEIP